MTTPHTTTAVEDFRSSEIVILEESDAKNTNAYIDAFQARRKKRMLAIMAGTILVLGVAAVVIVATNKSTDSASQSAGIGPSDGINKGSNSSETLVGGTANGNGSSSSFTPADGTTDGSTQSDTSSTSGNSSQNDSSLGGLNSSLADGSYFINGSVSGNSADGFHNGNSTNGFNNGSSTESTESNYPTTSPAAGEIEASRVPLTPTPTTGAPIAPPAATTTAAPTAPTATPTSPPTNPPATPAPQPPTEAPAPPAYYTPPPATPRPATPPPATPPPATPPPTTPSPPSPYTGSDLKAQIIKQTTVIRAAHGLGPVTWNDALAAQMQKWASDCSLHPAGGHGGPAGNQNLAGFDSCGSSCLVVPGPAWTWYDTEETLWNYDSNQSQDGVWDTTGHFSNSMDPGVNQIACGWSTCNNPNLRKADPLVWCNYLGGNNGRIPRPLIPKAQIKAQLTA